MPTVTTQWMAQLQALAAALPGYTPPTTTPPPSPTPTTGQVLVPPAASVTDSTGAVWTIGAPVNIYGSAILRNGASAAGGIGTTISYSNNTIKVLNATGDWWQWTGSGWARTTAP